MRPGISFLSLQPGHYSSICLSLVHLKAHFPSLSECGLGGENLSATTSFWKKALQMSPVRVHWLLVLPFLGGIDGPPFKFMVSRPFVSRCHSTNSVSASWCFWRQRECFPDLAATWSIPMFSKLYPMEVQASCDASLEHKVFYVTPEVIFVPQCNEEEHFGFLYFEKCIFCVPF